MNVNITTEELDALQQSLVDSIEWLGKLLDVYYQTRSVQTEEIYNVKQDVSKSYDMLNEIRKRELIGLIGETKGGIGMNDNLNDVLQDEADYFGSIIQDLQERNKRYREVIKVIEKYANDCIDVEVEMNPYLVIDDIKTLEESE